MDHYYIVEVEYQGVSEHMFMTAINGSEARRFAKEKFRKERSISTQSYVEAKIIAESNDAEEISSYFTLLTDPPNKITARFELTRQDIDPLPQEIFEHMTRLAVNKSCHEELKATRRVIAAMVRQQGGQMILTKEMFDWRDVDTKVMYVHMDPVVGHMVLELKEMPKT